MGSGGRDSPILSPSVYPERGFLAYSIDKRTHQELVVRSIETLEELYRMRIPIFGSMEWVDESHLFGVIFDDGRLSPRIVDLRNGEWSSQERCCCKPHRSTFCRSQ